MIVAKGAGRFAVQVLRRFVVPIVTTVLMVAAISSCSTPAAAPAEPSYGSLPTFLPSDSIQPDSILTGSAARPALTTEGDTVKVDVGQGATVRLTVTGPEVPGEGLPYQGESTTCTFTVQFSDATATVPINIADFSATDHLGGVYHPALVPGQPKPPTTIAPHQTVTVELRTIMRTGEGLMRWAPRNSLLASFDFEVEND